MPSNDVYMSDTETKESSEEESDDEEGSRSCWSPADEEAARILEVGLNLGNLGKFARGRPSMAAHSSGKAVVPSTIVKSAPMKKKRTATSPEQMHMLLSVFETNRYPTSAVKASLAARCRMTKDQVRIWFQNMRRKAKLKASASSEFGSD